VAAHWSQLTSLANFMYARLMSREDEPFSTPKVWYNFSVSACEERGG
jgi:predicted solute-binding protein